MGVVVPHQHQKSFQRGYLIKLIHKEQHIKCSICNDDGQCNNNIFFQELRFEFSDYLDCMLYLRKGKV